MNCPLCLHQSTEVFTAHGYSILDCNHCGHRFADVEIPADHTDKIYSDGYFTGGGAGYPDYLREGRIVRDHGRWYAKKLAGYMQPGQMLDVGAAAGFILQGFVDNGWQGRGIEPNAAMAQYARESLGMQVQVGALELFATSERCDLVSMIQVVAHFANIRAALGVAAEVTKPLGFWLIETWNKNSIAARAFGKNWHEYSPPSVLHWFSPKTLSALATQYGFREIARGRPSKWINGGHAKSLVKYKLSGSSAGRIVSRLLNVVPDYVPIPYPADDLFWMLLQKS